MGAGGHADGGGLSGEAGADREAATERLGHRHDIGRHTLALVREQAARTADAGLHLVEKEEQPVGIGEAAQLGEEAWRRHPDAALRPAQARRE